MKTIIISILAVLWYSCCFPQDTVPYGSNNGKYIDIDGTQLYYEEYGQGTPLLAIHGGLSTIADLGPVIAELSKQYRVIAVDCPGQGRSEQADSLSYQLLADYFSKIIDQMKLDSVYVFGHSDGGNAALLLAADRPDKVKKTAAFAAASHTSGYYPEAIAGLDQLNPEAFEKDFKWWLEPHLQRTPQKDQWKKFVRDFSAMCATPLIIPDAKLREVQSSVLIVQGDNDIVIPGHALALHQSIANSQLCFVPAASHFILYERPELFNLILIEFFNKEPQLFDWTQLGVGS